MDFTLPMRTYSEANRREHWARRAARAKEQRAVAKAALAAWVDKARPELPLIVRLTRIAPRGLDGDNLQRSLKAVRDGVADALGVDDADARVQWRYKQGREGTRYYAVRIEIGRWEEGGG